MEFGIIRERKVPPDFRSPLTPEQCVELDRRPSDSVVVEPSPNRCFSDDAYRARNVRLSPDLSRCDVLLGVKEVPIEHLLPGKTYLFFSHTIKEQPYNRDLLRAVLAKRIRLIDYEVLTDDNGARLIAFGEFAGMVGAHNAIWTLGRRTGVFDLPRMIDMKDYAEAKTVYRNLALPPVKIVLTGTGRVGNGAARVLEDMNVARVAPDEFLSNPDFDRAVFTQIDAPEYAARKDGKPFSFPDFFESPNEYRSEFLPYATGSDVFINGIYWDPRAPVFFTLEDMRDPGFRIRVISDVTCDIAPESSVPSTLRATTVSDPIFGFDPATGRETTPHGDGVVDVMSVDNLPTELPRDASHAFGRMFLDRVLPELAAGPGSRAIRRATIAENGKLGPHFQYLRDYAGGGAK